VDDHVRPRLGDRGLGDTVLGKIAVSPDRVDLVGSVGVTKLVVKGATDKPGSAREQHLHRRRVYWRACALLAVVLLVGCDHGKRRTEPQPPPGPKLSFLALDRQHQRLVRDYEPVSAAMTAYELAFRDWRLGRLSQDELLGSARSYRAVVVRAAGRLRRDPATGETTRAKHLFVSGLRARAKALAALPDLPAYRAGWNRSESDARAGLTVLQDIRDRARLIPLPEDSVS